MAPNNARHTVTSATALAVFANPVRARILDLLQLDEPLTTGQIAERLQIASGSASHHVRQLVQAGMVEEAPGHNTDQRKHYWRLVHPRLRWSRDELPDASARTAALESEKLSLEQQFARSRRALLASEDRGPGSGPEEGFVTQHWMHLSPEELQTMCQEVVEVFSRWASRPLPDDGTPRRSCFAFARAFFDVP